MWHVFKIYFRIKSGVPQLLKRLSARAKVILTFSDLFSLLIDPFDFFLGLPYYLVEFKRKTKTILSPHFNDGRKGVI